VRHRRCALFLALILFGLPILPAPAFEMAYWAWQRATPPNDEELRQLAVQDVHTIYWHIGELENTGETWRWTLHFQMARQSLALPIWRDTRCRVQNIGRGRRSAPSLPRQLSAQRLLLAPPQDYCIVTTLRLRKRF
jgi:hypothetical protein